MRKPLLTRRRVLAGGIGAAALAVGTGGYLLSRTPVRLMQGRSRARPVASSDGPLPTSVDVAVIGGGFVGTSAALTLAERGVSVLLCEKGVVAGEASGRSMGYVDSQLLAPEKMELIDRSRALWEALNARTGMDTGYRPTGLVAPLESREEESGAEAWIASVKERPAADGQIVRGAAFSRLFPDIVNPPRAALYTPRDASVEPQLAAPAMAEAAKSHGAKIIQSCAIRGIETAAGRVAGIVTERGSVRCQAVLLAGGTWTPLFAASLGIQLPQLDVYLSMMSLTKVEGPATPYSCAAYGFRPMVDGGYAFGVVDFAAPIQPATLRNIFRLKPAVDAFWPIAHVGLSPATFWRELTTSSKWTLDAPTPFEAYRVLVPAYRAGPLDSGLAVLREQFPVFKAAQVRERWAGIISALPDNMPIISAVARYPGLYIGSGFTYGLTMGPAAGEALADLATNRTPQINLHEYRMDRFTDGSPIAFKA